MMYGNSALESGTAPVLMDYCWIRILIAGLHPLRRRAHQWLLLSGSDSLDLSQHRASWLSPRLFSNSCVARIAFPPEDRGQRPSNDSLAKCDYSREEQGHSPVRR
jgi:hypothetical protein